jgi:hypothetical protein
MLANASVLKLPPLIVFNVKTCGTSGCTSWGRIL